LETDLSVCRAELADAKENAERMQALLSGQLSDARKEIAQLHEAIAENLRQISVLQLQVQEQNHQVQVRDQQHDQYILVLQKKYEVESRSNVAAELKEANNEISTNRQNIQSLNGEVKRLTESLDILRKELRERERKIKNMETRMSESDEAIIKFTSKGISDAESIDLLRKNILGKDSEIEL
jgi:chromosome segregation ATPase